MNQSFTKKLLLPILFLLFCNYISAQVGATVIVKQTYVYAGAGTIADLTSQVTGLLEPPIWMNAPVGGTAYSPSDPLVSGTKYYLKNTEDKTKYRIGTRLRINVFEVDGKLVPSKPNPLCAGETVDIKAEGLLTEEEFDAKNTNGLGLSLTKVAVFGSSSYYVKTEPNGAPFKMSWTAADNLISDIPGATMYIINGGTAGGAPPAEEVAVLAGLNALDFLNKPGPPVVASGFAFWLGLKQYGNATDFDDRTGVLNKGWYWMDGTPLEYQNWDKQPNGTLIEPNDYNANGSQGLPAHDEDNAEFNFQTRNAAAWVDAPDASPGHASAALFEFQGITGLIWEKYNTATTSWEPISGGTNGVLSVIAIEGTDKYRLLYNINGVPQTPITYDVIGVGVTIATQPVPATSCGEDVSFAVVSNGDTYQWQVSTDGATWNNVVDNAIYSDSNSVELKITNPIATMNGYLYRVNINKTGTTCSLLSDEVSLTVSTLATPTISAGGPTAFCTGGSVVLTSSSATGNIWSTSETTPSITVSTGGTYTVKVSNGSCTSAESIGTVVTVNPIPATPIITATGSTTLCAGESVVLTSSSATGNLWSTGETTESITVSTAGSYTVEVTTNGCTSPTSAGTTVTVNPIPATPTITTGSTTTFCTGGSVVLTSSSATGNIWSTGETTPSITVTTGGTYTVKVTGGGCTSAESAGTVVTVNPIPSTPTITATGPTAFCTGGNVVLTSSSATGNRWSTGEMTRAISVSTAGTYTVEVTINGCTSPTSAGTTVTVNPIPATPTITAGGPTAFCAGGNVVLTSSSTTGNIWSTGEITQSITVATSGTYTVQVSAGNCTSATSAGTVVTVNSLPVTPTITAGSSTTFCAGGNVVLTSSSTTGNRWSTGETTRSISVSTGGTYTVEVFNGSCSSAKSAGMVVTVNPIPATPTITAGGSTSFCIGGNVVLTSSSTTGNIWSTGDTTPSITVTTAGTYTVKVVENGCASPSSAGTIVTVNPLPNINTNVNGRDNVVVCSGSSTISVMLDAGIQDSTPTSDYTYVWLKNGAAMTPAETNSVLNATSDGVYTVEVTSKATGCSKIRTIKVIPSEAPVIASIDVVELSESNSITIHLNPGKGNYVYTINGINGVYQESNFFKNIAPGVYEVFVKDNNNCGSDSRTVYVIGAPKFFTPNSDGYNDYWNLQGVKGSVNENSNISIFDRYGKLIKELKPKDQGWDGTFNGALLPATDYWFSVKLLDGREARGHFSLKR
ncbi:T9SS type B sorting domain-containing protein [Flavobacterium sp.]|uniref:T9SS type B sorting domain-containing protein n=1 Tax=Flavobacterium sp. TaxID=239 RepID=UPI003C42A567